MSGSSSSISSVSNTSQDKLSATELAQTLRSADLKHAALNRVRARLLSVESVEAIITSYDRMHHRHSRS